MRCDVCGQEYHEPCVHPDAFDNPIGRHVCYRRECRRTLPRPTANEYQEDREYQASRKAEDHEAWMRDTFPWWFKGAGE